MARSSSDDPEISDLILIQSIASMTGLRKYIMKNNVKRAIVESIFNSLTEVLMTPFWENEITT